MQQVGAFLRGLGGAILGLFSKKTGPARPGYMPTGARGSTGLPPTKADKSRPASRFTRGMFRGVPAVLDHARRKNQKRRERKAMMRSLGVSFRAYRRLRRVKTDKELAIVLARWRAAGRFPVAVRELRGGHRQKEATS